ncbi:phosphate-starvation-inducible PsiE family protein [Shivajiella indica]|uniref:Phosphate-starvation-inducible PsiE family protein n=1 Tax=Shivajiella indica TaxID=872115 RepID=A0ABW5B6E9_9BACT
MELIASLVEYLKVGSKNYVKVITEIALIATVRHLLAIDFEHMNANVLFGLSALIFVLGLFFLLATKQISFNNGMTTKNENSEENKNG